MKETPDWELIARHNAGDKSAFEEIVRRYAPRLRPIIGRLLRQYAPDVQDAVTDDVLQEVWIRLTRFSTRLDPKHVFSTWLFTVATNLALNEHRGWRKKTERMSMQKDQDTGVFEEKEPEDTRPRPDALCESKDTVKKLGHYLSQHASRKNIQVLEMWGQGYTYAEIGARLGLEMGTVKSRLHRARRVARRFLREMDK